MALPQSAWMDLTLAPAEAPTVERCRAADGVDTYELAFERACLSVILTPAELQELIARSLVAQSTEPLVDLT